MNGNEPRAKEDFKSGYATLIGAPNAGKSTLLNRILGEKIAITTPKPQTTRDAIIGVKHVPGAQVVFVDTPGVHEAKGTLNKAMVQQALCSLDGVDVVVFVVDVARQVRAAIPEVLHRDQRVLEMLKECGKPVLLALNKVDRVKKELLLPLIESWTDEMEFAVILPLSAKTGVGVDTLVEEVVSRFGKGPAYFPEDMVTDRSMRFLAAEMIREKLFFQLGQELPYSVAVSVDNWTDKEKVTVIEAAIHVERDSQKGIVVGAKGSRVKQVGIAARIELEKALDRKVHLELRVRVQEKWSEDLRSLERFGYLDTEGDR